jgi:3-keto-disaccharide hydrolase
MKRYLGLMVFLALALAMPAAGQQKGFVSLFDGKTLNGWMLVGGIGPGYVVEHGMLVCPANGGGNLFTKKEYANFVFRFEFLLDHRSNNGVGLRAPLEGRPTYQGMEIQIIDNSSDYAKHLPPTHLTGSIYDVVPARVGFLKAVGQWNKEEILAQGRHIRVTLNGHVILDENLDDIKDPATLKRHPGLQRTEGHIAFLGHRSRVEFRNIRIKELD